MGGHTACEQNADLECKDLDSSSSCCAQISVEEFVLIILGWTEDRFELRPSTVV